MQVEILTRHLYLQSKFNRKEMLLIRISGQSRFELSFIFLMLLSLRKGLVGSLHYYQC